MTPKMAYLAAVGLATLQTSQAFLIPSSFNFPGLKQAGKDGKPGQPDVISSLPVPKEDMMEKMKNLQLGVSKPFPFSIHSGDVEEANEKAKHYFRKACKKFKGHAKEVQDDVQDFGNKAEEELKELESKLLDWWKDNVPSQKEVQEDVAHFESEIESEIDDIDWSKFGFTNEKGDAVEDEADEEYEDPPEGVQRFSFALSYPDVGGNVDNDDDSNSVYIELVNMETGEITRERFDLSDFDMGFNMGFDEDQPNHYNDGPMKAHEPHFHHPIDTVISPEWHDKIRLSPHTHGKMRCMRSRFRRAMRSVASALRAFVTGFLIPVLIGVAAGMAASLFGMLVGTLCGWLWVKLFRGGRRAEDEAEFIENRPAGDGLGEKDALLVVESIDSDEDAPPVYVEKE